MSPITTTITMPMTTIPRKSVNIFRWKLHSCGQQKKRKRKRTRKRKRKKKKEKRKKKKEKRKKKKEKRKKKKKKENRKKKKRKRKKKRKEGPKVSMSHVHIQQPPQQSVPHSPPQQQPTGWRSVTMSPWTS